MNWNKFNFHNFWIPTMIFFILGIVAGILFPRDCKPQKDYPVKVEVCYETKDYWYTKIECDSVKGDTIYKDSLSIVNKNIVNVTFK